MTPAVLPEILLDETVIGAAIREALANLGYEPDSFPPGNPREPGSTSIEAALNLARGTRVRPFTTSAIIDAAFAKARSETPASQARLLSRIETDLREELGPILRVQSRPTTVDNPLRTALEDYEPAVVVSSRASMPFVAGNDSPITLDARAWIVWAEQAVG